MLGVSTLSSVILDQEPTLEAEQRYVAYRAILVAIVFHNYWVLVFMGYRTSIARHAAMGYRTDLPVRNQVNMGGANFRQRKTCDIKAITWSGSARDKLRKDFLEVLLRLKYSKKREA